MPDEAKVEQLEAAMLRMQAQAHETEADRLDTQFRQGMTQVDGKPRVRLPVADAKRLYALEEIAKALRDLAAGKQELADALDLDAVPLAGPGEPQAQRNGPTEELPTLEDHMGQHWNEHNDHADE